MPFLVCILIYTNLHDTIGFVNPHDVHHFLDALDRELFGVQPTVWAERFITPARTEVMQFLYLNFFWIAPSTSLILLAAEALGRVPRGHARRDRVLLPRLRSSTSSSRRRPPRLVLVYEFKRNLAGYPQLFSNLSARAFELLPVDSRAAFPSLHAAVSLVVLIYAWRYLRAWFWRGCCRSCWGCGSSTIYLRHHYTVDLLAGWLLAPVAVAVAPRLDAWWTRAGGPWGCRPSRASPEGGARDGRAPGPEPSTSPRVMLRRPALVAPGERQRGAVAGRGQRDREQLDGRGRPCRSSAARARPPWP